jgi:hypothetical protein
MGSIRRMNARGVSLSLMLLAMLCAPLTMHLAAVHAQAVQQAPAAGNVAKAVGAIKVLSGSNITLTADAGNDVAVVVQDAARVVRVEPGQTDLKTATPIQLQDLQIGDRLLVRGKFAGDGKSVLATSVVAMKKSDVAEKQAREREEWQRHGIGGLVSGVDADNATITISTMGFSGTKTVVIHAAKTTIVRRYAPDSVKFDEAKSSALESIKASDQVRARGTRSADGGDFFADEIVSGSFRNIAGMISSIDAAAGTLGVADAVSKKTVTVKITAESQMRKLAAAMAQRIAMRLKATPEGAPSAPGGAPRATDAASASAPRAGGGAGAPGGPAGANRNGGAPDLQQAIQRMPAAALTDFQKGDAVMIVATEGSGDGPATAITMLGGVEPILEASPKNAAATILSPWSINTGGGDAGAQ